MTAQELEQKIRELLADDLNLEDGEMMMPLKPHEIGMLAESIRELVMHTVRDGAR